MSQREPILLVEDDQFDVLLLRRVVERGGIGNEIQWVGDGEDALDYLRHRGAYASLDDFPRPVLVLLDLKMPRMGGLELLSVMQHDPDLRSIPVVVLTASDDPTDRDTAKARGAAGYLVKPATADQIIEAAAAAGVELVVGSEPESAPH